MDLASFCVNIHNNYTRPIIEDNWSEDNDSERYMWEEVMTFLYGEKFFDWFI